MFRETTDSFPRSETADSYEEKPPSDGGHSPDQPTQAGLKGTGRPTTPDDASTAGRRPRSAASRGSRATGGFLTRLLGADFGVHSCDRGSRRAQTSIDFVVGASVFLLTVAFVVGFLPGVFEPFTASGEGDVLAADRTASLLAEQALAEPTTPGVFDAACAAEFFDGEGDGAGGVAGCRFDADAAALDAALGLSPSTAVNVTIEDNGTVRSVHHDGASVDLRAGPTPPASESVVVSRRVVLLGGEESDLYVRVW